MKYNLAPICLFTFNRLDETQKTVLALQKNNLAHKSQLFIFSDGWKYDKDKEEIEEVRAFLKTIIGFKKITIFKSEINKGLANSIITGVTKIINKFGKVIVLEDDLITSPNFLDFMNQALYYYEYNERVFSVSGYSMDLSSLKGSNNDYYLGYRGSSCGWGSWRKEWNEIDWEIKDYEDFKNSKTLIKAFKIGGSDLPGMLKNQMNKTIDSWAIRWCYNQFKKNQFTVFPTISKVESIGFNSSATHTKRNIRRFNTKIDKTNKTEFLFDNSLIINKKLVKQQQFKFSFINRFFDKFSPYEYIKILFSYIKIKL